MKKITEKEAIKLIEKYSNSSKDFDNVLLHCKAVQKLAVSMAKKVNKKSGKDLVDEEFVNIAALLHDIGRFSCPPGSGKVIRHGIEGAKILKKEGLPKCALVAERHLGAGISKQEVIDQKLDLPAKDYLPVSIEEKIIANADNLIFGTRIGTIKEVLDRFSKELGQETADKVKQLYDEIEAMI